MSDLERRVRAFASRGLRGRKLSLLQVQSEIDAAVAAIGADDVKLSNACRKAFPETYRAVMDAAWRDIDGGEIAPLAMVRNHLVDALVDRDIASERLKWCRAVLDKPELIGLDSVGINRIDAMRLVYEAIVARK